MGLSAPTGPDLGLGEGDFSGADSIMKAAKLGPYTPDFNKKSKSTIAQDGSYDQASPGWATSDRATDADEPRSPVTPATDPDSPLLTRIRSMLGGLDLFAGE
jgi:hypothetical protein